MVDYLRQHPCVDCGNADIRVLEFDHCDGSTKLRAIAVLAGQGYGLAKVQAEIEECEVRCANCHRIRTHLQRGWWGKDVTDMVGMVDDVGQNGRARRDSNPWPSDP